jgi:hypothetical protein
MKMAADKKQLGLTYLVSWHKEPRSIDEKGVIVTNIQRYYDIVGLMEMAKFNGKRNADTILADLIAMYMIKEYVYKEELKDEQEETKSKGFFSRGLYGGGDNNWATDEKVVSLG